MAAAFFNQLAAPGRATAVSAGTNPSAFVHPEVVEVMKEVGIDLSGAVPRKLDDDICRGAGLLITMGCGEDCPFIPGVRRDDWPFEDPAGKPPDRVRGIRDAIRSRVLVLLAAEGWV